MLRAYASFGESVWESCSKQAELKAIVFALCFFHSVVCERRKFGPIGWNNGYPFNQGDLSVCIAVANNYLDNSSKVRRRSLAMRRSPARRAPRHHCAPAPLCPCARRSRRARAPDVPPWPHTGALGRPALHLWRDHVRRAHHRQQGPAAVLGVPEHLPARGAARVAPVLPVVRGAAAARARAVPRVHRGAPRHRDARRVRAAHQLGDQLYDAAGTPAPTPDP